MKTVRLKDIAEKTGFSISTVSRILSGDPTRKMKEETINLVLRTANDMGYYRTRKQLLRQAIPTVRIIALFISEHHTIGPVTLGILDGIRKEVTEQQHQMRLEYEAISISDSSFRDRMSMNDLDVAIMVGHMEEEVFSFVEDHVPYIIYAGLDSLSRYDEIITDCREGIRRGIALLAGLKCRHIAFIGPVGHRNGYAYLGYLEGLADNFMERDSNLMEISGTGTSDGYEAAEKLLARIVPDAIVAANDNIAIGVLRSLKERGIACPEDIKLIGFGNQEASAYLEPSLTTFDVPKSDLGRFAVKIAIDRSENPRSGNLRVTLPYALIERESTRL